MAYRDEESLAGLLEDLTRRVSQLEGELRDLAQRVTELENP